MQPGGRFPTVGKLIDHIFLVERRHLQRLTGDTLSNSTGLTGNNAPPLFDYGASVRRELEQFASVIDEDEARETRAILDPGGDRDDLAAEAALRHPHSRDQALGTSGAGPPHRRHRATGGARSSLQPRAEVERSSAQRSPQRTRRAQRLQPRTTRISRIRSLVLSRMSAAAGLAPPRLPVAFDACPAAASALSATSVVICLRRPSARSVRRQRIVLRIISTNASRGPKL